MVFKKAAVILLCFVCSISWACEFGRTYMDYNLNGTEGKPNSYDYAVMSDGGAYYFPQGSIENAGSGTIWERVHFKDGRIKLHTGYTWCAGKNPPPEGKEPYILYKGHRWYPQYHGFIYVYEDGEERK